MNGLVTTGAVGVLVMPSRSIATATVKCVPTVRHADAVSTNTCNTLASLSPAGRRGFISRFTKCALVPTDQRTKLGR